MGIYTDLLERGHRHPTPRLVMGVIEIRLSCSEITGFTFSTQISTFDLYPVGKVETPFLKSLQLQEWCTALQRQLLPFPAF